MSIRRVTSPAAPEPPPEPPVAPPVPFELERMHADHVLRFAISPGFGKSRMIRMPQQLFITLAGTSYRVIRPDLIALETKPVAYRNPGEEEVIGMSMLTNRAMKAVLRTRPITKDEANAIMELRQPVLYGYLVVAGERVREREE